MRSGDTRTDKGAGYRDAVAKCLNGWKGVEGGVERLVGTQKALNTFEGDELSEGYCVIAMRSKYGADGLAQHWFKGASYLQS